MMRLGINMPEIFDGDLDRYYWWNINSAANAVLTNPDEYQVISQVYTVHKIILKGRGYDERKLEEGDDLLIERILKMGRAQSN